MALQCLRPVNCCLFIFDKKVNISTLFNLNFIQYFDFQSHEPAPPIGEMEKLRLELESRRGTPRPGSARRPPWRGSDPAPKDTWRNNVLDNDDEIEKVSKL